MLLGDYLLLDKRYLNFEIFDFLFKDYQERDLEFYKVIYAIIIKYRA